LSSIIEGLLSLVGALGSFLYAISRFGDGVQKLAGERMRIIFEKQAKNPAYSFFSGIGMAAALQSNILTFGMITSLINASFLSLLPALWTMLGVNLGMTLTAQLMSINIGPFLFLLLFLGYLIYFYGNKHSLHYLGQILFNVGLMYLSFRLFHHAFKILEGEPHAVYYLRMLLTNPWLGFLLGLGLAAMFRSSNTVVVLAQSMVGINLGLTPVTFLSGAFAIVIGANAGTTIINMLSGRDRLPVVRKANWFHLSFNLSTAILSILFLPMAYFLVHGITLQINGFFHNFAKTVFDWNIVVTAESDRWFNVWQIAMAHTLFNMTVICIWFPITFVAGKMGLPILKGDVKIGTNGSTYLDRRALQTPALALILAAREIKQMADITQRMLKSARLAFIKNQLHLIDGIIRDETVVDDLQEQITFYLSALLSQNSLTEAQSHRLAGLLHIVSDVERVGDHAYNIANLAEKRYREQLQFSELALNEIELMFGKVIDFYSKACQAFSDNQQGVAKQLLSREEGIDKLEEELRQNHIHRLNQGKCWPSSGVVYVEMLSNLQRVAAHSANIASASLEEGEE